MVFNLNTTITTTTSTQNAKRICDEPHILPVQTKEKLLSLRLVDPLGSGAGRLLVWRMTLAIKVQARTRQEYVARACLDKLKTSEIGTEGEEHLVRNCVQCRKKTAL